MAGRGSARMLWESTRRHLLRFSSCSSLTRPGFCTDTGMMLPGNSGRRGSGMASTCVHMPSILMPCQERCLQHDSML
jgi:hypothetical protein